MKTPKSARKPRKKSSRTMGVCKRPDLSAKLKALWATPEFQEKMRLRNLRVAELKKLDPVKFTRTGVPNGMRKPAAKRLWAKAEQAADRFITMLEDEGDLPKVTVPDSDEGMAKAALKEAFTLAIVPGDLKIKMAAIRTVLDFTKSKPESKSKVTVETAEDWLKAAKADMENND